MTQQKLKLEYDYLIGNINRIMVSNYPKEIHERYKYACEHLLTIYNERVNQIKEEKTESENI